MAECRRCHTSHKETLCAECACEIPVCDCSDALTAYRARIAAAIRARMHQTLPLQAYETLEDLLRVVEG